MAIVAALRFVDPVAIVAVPAIGVGVGAVAAGVGETEVRLALGESGSTVLMAADCWGSGDLFIRLLVTLALLLSEEVEAVLKAGLATGVSKIEAIAFIAGVLLTLLRGSTGLNEQHWFRIGVSRWFVEELSCQLMTSLPNGLLS